MAFKRKRSCSELCSSPSSTSSSPPRLSAFTMTDLSATHLHSRTLKRFRNGRPSEEDVHHRTLDMLYSAQQQQQQRLLPRHRGPAAMETPMPQTTSTAQQSLHRFWSINSTPSTVVTTLEQPMATPSNCEDCGASVADGMEVDGCATACCVCAKTVCFGCSVSNLGEQKRCLGCAGRGSQTGGNGWAGMSMLH